MYEKKTRYLSVVYKKRHDNIVKQAMLSSWVFKKQCFPCFLRKLLINHSKGVV